MSKGRKGILIAACILAALIIGVAVIAPRIFQVNRYRPYVIQLIEQKTGRQVEIGRLDLSVFPSIKIRVDDFAISNPAGFPAGDWLRVGRIDARLDAGALWHHRIVIRSLDLNGPDLALLSDAHGRWNYAMPPARKAAPDPPPSGNPSSGPAKSADPAPFSLQEISEVTLKDGGVSLGSLTAAGNAGTPVVIGRGLSATLHNINLVEFSGPQTAGGNTSPVAGEAKLKSLEAGNLELQNVVSEIQADPSAVHLNNVKFDFYGGRGAADILLKLAAPVPQYTARGELSGVNAAELLDRFPQGRGELTGTLQLQFELSGDARNSPDPWAGKQGHGTLTVQKGRLPKLQLDKAMLELARLAQMGPVSGDPSAFSLIALDWRLANGSLATTNVRVNGNGMALEGAGTIGLAGAGSLKYQGVAEVTAQKNMLTNMLANLSGASFSKGKLGVPFSLEGTLQKPQFRLETAGALSSPASTRNGNQTQQDIRGLLNLFKHKK